MEQNKAMKLNGYEKTEEEKREKPEQRKMKGLGVNRRRRRFDGQLRWLKSYGEEFL